MTWKINVLDDLYPEGAVGSLTVQASRKLKKISLVGCEKQVCVHNALLVTSNTYYVTNLSVLELLNNFVENHDGSFLCHNTCCSWVPGLKQL